MSVYLDCNATTPIEPEVAEVVMRYMRDEYGNSGSRTHAFGVNAKKAVERAREYVAAVVGAEADEVIFTSGATESNNLALIGLVHFGLRSGRKHIVATSIEHKAVLEPLEHLRHLGFDVTLVPPSRLGRIAPEDVSDALRQDTLAVSVMHVNNETGVIQPIAEIADALGSSEAYFHVDAAQGFGKEIASLRNRRIDLISISAHKIYGPKGVGALIARRRAGKRPPITPLLFGGGQERGLRPGTLPVPLIAGLGEASRIALRDHERRWQQCLKVQQEFRRALSGIDHYINGDESSLLPTTINLSFPGVDSEAAMLALKEIVAISNGSACTSAHYSRSHVLVAMGLPFERCDSALRFSWCHLTPPVPWDEVVRTISKLM